MPVSPQKAIGTVACIFVVVCTLAVLSRSSSDNGFSSLQGNSAPIFTPVPPAVATQPNRFNGAQSFKDRLPNNRLQNNRLPNNGLPTTASPAAPIVDPLVQPAQYRTPLARYPLNQTQPTPSYRQPSPARLPQVANTPTQSFNQPAAAIAQIAPADMVALQSLPPACTTDLQTLIEESQRARQLTQQTQQTQQPLSNSNDFTANPISQAGGFETSSDANVADGQQLSSQDLLNYNPHQKASFSNSTASKKKPAAPESKGASKDSKGDTKDPQDTSTADKPDPHLDIYSRDAFPSARECKACHEQIYDEWASSSHAYASVSPMFHAFEDKINRLTSGTIGYFCLRCHAPVATTMGLRRDQPIWDGPAVFREGVTCVACHRVKTPFSKTDGERRIEPGDIYAPVYGGSNGSGVATVAKYKDKYKVKTDRHDKSVGQKMHRRSIQFEELSESTFCMSCHQVAVKPGIKLEVVWDQYRASPACKEGVTCQDCHMGIVPGVDAGYSFGPAAVVDGKIVGGERKHSNHMFYGPGYSIAHPGVFPQNTDGDKWSFNQWLEFDWRSQWGTEKFEDDLADGLIQAWFPPAWDDADDRVDAREVIDDNLKKLSYKKDLRRQLLENGSKLDGPFFAEPPQMGQPLNFNYCVTNTNPGHNMPSGSLGAQPQLWMNVVLISPGGQRLWETGYVDSNGDLADNHSLDVLSRLIPFDDQLFNLQSKFFVTNVKGTDREVYLPINFDVDQLPFLRPAQQPVTVINHPPGIRLEGHSIPPLGSRKAKFSVPPRLITQPGTYRLSVRMRSRAEPIYFMRFVNATPEMERMMNEWIVDFHVNTVTFEVH